MRKRKTKFSVYPIGVFLLSLFVIVGCSDDDDTLPDNDVQYGTVTDIDGNEYKTVTIGNQEWMAENLRVTRYRNGDEIPGGLSANEWYNTSDGAAAIYNQDPEMLEAYGKLYNWFAVADSRGLCPEGWSVPSDDDWTQLVNYVVERGYPDEADNLHGAANALKSCRQEDSPLGGDCNTSVHPRWVGHDTHYGFDQFGFSAKPGGRRAPNGAYYNLGGIARWWTSSRYSATDVWLRSIGHNDGNIARGRTSWEGSGVSIRCVRD